MVLDIDVLRAAMELQALGQRYRTPYAPEDDQWASLVHPCWQAWQVGFRSQTASLVA